MDSKNIDLRKDQLRDISLLCEWLDVFGDPDIQEGIVCAMDCGVGMDMPRAINSLVNLYVENAQSIIGDTELNALRELKEKISRLEDYHYSGETAEWFDFLDCTKRVNALLNDAIERDEKNLIKIQYLNKK